MAIDLHIGQRIQVLGRTAKVMAVGPQQSIVRFVGDQHDRVICNTWATAQEIDGVANE